MKKYTYEDWLAGKDEIPADSDLFNSDNWEKVKKKQKSIYESLVDQNFIFCKEDFHYALEESIDQEHFIRSGFESLEMIFNTKYRRPSQDVQIGKGTAFYRNIQFVSGLGYFKYTDIRNTYYNVLEGKKSYSMITFTDVAKIEDSNKSLSIELWTIALYKLYKFVEAEYEDLLNSTAPIKMEKIKWLGTVSHLGYIFNQLLEQGFIELPEGRGHGYSILAERCDKIFDYNGKLSSLKKEIAPAGSSLEEYNRKEFKIPKRTKLSK